MTGILQISKCSNYATYRKAINFDMQQMQSYTKEKNIHKFIYDDGEGINRLAGSGRKTVADRDSLRDAIRGTASLAGCY